MTKNSSKNMVFESILTYFGILSHKKWFISGVIVKHSKAYINSEIQNTSPKRTFCICLISQGPRKRWNQIVFFCWKLRSLGKLFSLSLKLNTEITHPPTTNFLNDSLKGNSGEEIFSRKIHEKGKKKNHQVYFLKYSLVPKISFRFLKFADCFTLYCWWRN